MMLLLIVLQLLATSAFAETPFDRIKSAEKILNAEKDRASQYYANDRAGQERILREASSRYSENLVGIASSVPFETVSPEDAYGIIDRIIQDPEVSRKQVREIQKAIETARSASFRKSEAYPYIVSDLKFVLLNMKDKAATCMQTTVASGSLLNLNSALARITGSQDLPLTIMETSNGFKGINRGSQKLKDAEGTGELPQLAAEECRNLKIPGGNKTLSSKLGTSVNQSVANPKPDAASGQ